MIVSVSNRLLEVDLPAGCPSVKPIAFSGSEQIGRPFQYVLELRCTDESPPDVVADACHEEQIAVGLLLADGERRWFHGQVSECSVDYVERLVSLRIEPALARLDLSATSEMFVGQDLKQIVTQLLDKHGVADVQWPAGQIGGRRESVMQYEESDLNFVQRLLEHEGVAYHFEHHRDSHLLIFHDAGRDWDDNPYQRSIGLSRARLSPLSQTDDLLDAFHRRQTSTATDWETESFDPHAPRAALSAAAATRRPGAQAASVRETACHFHDAAEAERVCRIRQDCADSERVSFFGAGPARCLSAGHVIRISPADADVLVTRVDFHAVAGGEGRERSFHASFEGVPAEQPYRPQREAAWPAPGLLTAMVAGPQGESDSAQGPAHCDEFGRVRVRFSWDRSTGCETSAWVPVLQPWAGPGRGAFALPRIGDHVLVGFLNGHPDRPCVVGSLFGPSSALPFDPKQHGRKLLLQASNNGCEAGGSLAISDEPGDEEFAIRAKKDFTSHVGGDLHLACDGEVREAVGGDQHLQVRGDSYCSCEGDVAQHAAGDYRVTSSNDFAVEAKRLVFNISGSTLVIDSSGVWINGAKIGLNSGGPSGGDIPQASPLPPEFGDIQQQ